MKCLSCCHTKVIRKIAHPEGGSYIVCQVCGTCERVTRNSLIEFSPQVLTGWEADEIDRLKALGETLARLMKGHPNVLPSKLMLF